MSDNQSQQNQRLFSSYFIRELPAELYSDALSNEIGSSQKLLTRIPEPEVMEDAGQVEAYAKADFSTSHNEQVNKIKELFPNLEPKRILDLGCGSGDITRRVSSLYPNAQVLAVDASENMILKAEEQTKQAGLDQRVKYQKIYLPITNKLIPSEASFDLVLCTNILHHLNSTEQLWTTIDHTVTKGSAVYITDLIRPETYQDAQNLVRERASLEHPILQKDFLCSLLASYRLAEIAPEIKQRFPWLKVEAISSTHFAIFGERN